MINKSLSLANKLFKRRDVSLLVSLRLSEIQKVQGVNVHIGDVLSNVDAHIGRGSTIAVESVKIKQDGLRCGSGFSIVVVQFVLFVHEASLMRIFFLGNGSLPLILRRVEQVQQI